MKVQRVLFNTHFYDAGVVKYAKGEHYPKTEQTDSCVLAGHAEYVDVDMDQDDAAQEQKAADDKLAAERRPTTEAQAAVERGGDAIPVAPAAATEPAAETASARRRRG